jgi:trehalose-6-phosphate synthase
MLFYTCCCLQVIALQALADVALIASLREGVNLGAMEFIACQQEARQVLLFVLCIVTEVPHTL